MLLFLKSLFFLPPTPHFDMCHFNPICPPSMSGGGGGKFHLSVGPSALKMKDLILMVLVLNPSVTAVLIVRKIASLPHSYRPHSIFLVVRPLMWVGSHLLVVHLETFPSPSWEKKWVIYFIINHKCFIWKSRKIKIELNNFFVNSLSAEQFCFL